MLQLLNVLRAGALLEVCLGGLDAATDDVAKDLAVHSRHDDESGARVDVMV